MTSQPLASDRLPVLNLYPVQSKYFCLLATVFVYGFGIVLPIHIYYSIWGRVLIYLQRWSLGVRCKCWSLVLRINFSKIVHRQFPKQHGAVIITYWIRDNNVILLVKRRIADKKMSQRNDVNFSVSEHISQLLRDDTIHTLTWYCK